MRLFCHILHPMCNQFPHFAVCNWKTIGKKPSSAHRVNSLRKAVDNNGGLMINGMK